MKLIEVGDEVYANSFRDILITVMSVTQGQYGLLICGTFSLGGDYEGYLPFELPPCESMFHNGQGRWYGWLERTRIRLSSGIELGVVAVAKGDATASIEAYDLKWEETIKLMGEENGE